MIGLVMVPTAYFGACWTRHWDRWFLEVRGHVRLPRPMAHHHVMWFLDRRQPTASEPLNSAENVLDRVLRSRADSNLNRGRGVLKETVWRWCLKLAED